MNNSPLYNVDKRPTWGHDNVDIRPGIHGLRVKYTSNFRSDTWSEWKLALLKCGRIENFIDELNNQQNA